nr:reticulocyte-binding protein homolog 2a-like [Pocillopora verrucosa]
MRKFPESRFHGPGSRLYNERLQHYIFYQINALSNNLETVTSLVKALSAITENLNNQASTAVKGTGNEEEFKQIFDKFANHTKQIQNVTKKLNKTVGHVNELAAVWSETTITFNKHFKSLKEKTGQTQDDIEDLERKLTEKIDKLEQEVKTLKVSLSYAQEESASLKEKWPEGKFCILANGRCPRGFRRHEGHLKSLYLYSSHSQFVNSAKFGSSSIGCYGSYCGQYGNFIGSLTLITCCK